MSGATITIDGRRVKIEPGQTILQVARAAGIDIPSLCYLEKCGPLNTCQACLVKLDGKLVPSCGMKVHPDMVVESETEEVHEARRTALELLFSDHVGDCLAPCQRLCPLGLNIPALLRNVQREQTPEAVRTVRSSLPLPGVLGRLCHHPCEQGCRRGHWDDPAGIRDIERHVSELDFKWVEPPPLEHRKQTIAIIGAGPSGLSAAYHLTGRGYGVTVLDRNSRIGGALRDLPEDQLPRAVLDAEAAFLERMGIQFRLGVEVGKTRALDDLLKEFKAVMIATGELDAEAIQRIGLPATGTFLKADPNTCQTPHPNVFATGASVRVTRQLVRVMAEAKTAAECLDRALQGQAPTRASKPFSSVMGKLAPAELQQFLTHASKAGGVTPCDRCAGLNRLEAVSSASRCLHCDCEASGNCLLQHYAQVYNVDAGRFRSERRTYDQQEQPGGVVFEPGKCILCGICVKLTELAAEPLGLTFIGRGFDVRVGAPLNHTIEEGIRKTAAECVEHCPTGALSFRKT